VFFAGLVLRNRSIWPAVILHALFDFGGGLKEIVVGGTLQKMAVSISMQDAAVSILLTLPLFMFGLYILRKVQPADIFPGSPTVLPQLDCS
jgi:uncharacterized protein